MLNLLEKLMAEMKVLKFEESGQVLDGLEFVQSVGATALWKFNCNLDSEVESFVRGGSKCFAKTSLDVLGNSFRVILY